MENESVCDIFVNMFSSSGEADLVKKKQALERLPQTFAKIDEYNIQDYVDFLRDWVITQIQAWALIMFSSHLKQLYDKLTAESPELCEKLLLLCLQLLVKDDQQVRAATVNLTADMLNRGWGISFTKNLVRKLLNEPYKYPSFDSGLQIYRIFKDRFVQKNAFNDVLRHQNLYNSFKSKKILAENLVKICQDPLPRQTAKTIYQVVAVLKDDEDEGIRATAIKIKIILLHNCFKAKYQVNPEFCFNQIKPLYQSPLIRIRFILIQLTAEIVAMVTEEGINLHFEYLKASLQGNQAQLAEKAIQRLKYIFKRMGKDKQQALLQLILAKKADTGVEETVAANIIDLLIEIQKEEMLVGFLSKFSKGKEQSVKLILVKSFFRHEKAADLYLYFKSLLDQLYKSVKWRTRHQCLQVIDKIIEKFGIDQDMTDRLTNLIIHDVAYRVRSDSIKLIAKYYRLPNIQQVLIPTILQQHVRSDYRRRLIVLQLIEKTYPLLSGSLQAQQREVVRVLAGDKIQNVSSTAKLMLSMMV